MTWYYKQLGNHTHVRVFCNGALCGTLVFTNAEFIYIFDTALRYLSPIKSFVREDEPGTPK